MRNGKEAETSVSLHCCKCSSPRRLAGLVHFSLLSIFLFSPFGSQIKRPEHSKGNAGKIQEGPNVPRKRCRLEDLEGLKFISQADP
jgi:hypothetical protein